MKSFLPINSLVIFIVTVAASSCGDQPDSHTGMPDHGVDTVRLEAADHNISTFVFDTLILAGATTSPSGLEGTDTAAPPLAPDRTPYIVFRASTTKLQNLVGRIWEKGASEVYRPYGPSLLDAEDKVEVTLSDEEPYVREVTEWENNGDASLLAFLNVQLSAGQQLSTTLSRTVSVSVEDPAGLEEEAVQRLENIEADNPQLKKLYVLEAIDCWVLTYTVHQHFRGRGDLNVPLIFTAKDEGFKKIEKTKKILLFTATLVPLTSYQ